MKNHLAKAQASYKKTLPKVKAKMHDLNHLEVHKIFLILALFFTVLFSFVRPLFTEPDAQYHLVVSANITRVTPDLTDYGEQNFYGYGKVIDAVQGDTYFRNYYLNEVNVMDMTDVPRGDAYSIPSLKSYNFWGHLIPAFGVWTGYKIYPSIGVMYSFGRLFSGVACSIALYFIIRYVKRGKLIFMAVFLSPVSLTALVSLNYDGLSFVYTAAMVAFFINMIDKGLIMTKKELVAAVLLPLSSFFFVKTNLLMVNVLYVPLFFEYFMNRRRKDNLARSEKRKGEDRKTVAIRVGLISGLIIAPFALTDYGGIFTVSIKIFMNLALKLNRTDNNFNNINHVFVQPNEPWWLFGVWFVLFSVLLFVEERFVFKPIYVIGAWATFLLTVFATYMGFYNGAGIIINGVQGRYLTPIFLVFIIIVGGLKTDLRIPYTRGVKNFNLFILIISNILMVVSFWYGIIVMGW